MSNFIHLQTKSHYSISCGLPKTNQIIDKALELGMKAVALTDKNTFFGLVKFYNYALEKGIKPICGVDFDVRVNDGYTNLILLAKNKKGLESLFKLSTESFTNSGLDKKSISEQDILDYAEHLVCIIPASSMNLRNLALKKEESLIVNLYTKYQKAFAKNLFVGVSNVSELGYDSASALACNLAKKNNIPTVAINDVLFLEKEDHLAHQAKVAINNSTLLKDEINNPNVSNEQYFKTEEELRKYHDLEPLKNTLEVAKLCNVFLDEGQYYLPSYEVNDNKSLSEHLEELSRNKLNEYLNKNKHLNTNLYHERLEKELKIITEKGYPGYFLIVMDFVKWAKSQEIPVGPGRGSGAGSLVAFMLSITALDPLEHGLLFERFLNPERMSLPDFDIDFCIEGRDKVIEYVQNKYGVESVAQIGTLGTMAARGVTRDVTRILGKPYGFGDMIAKMIPLTPGIKLKEAIDGSPELQQIKEDNEEATEVLDLSLKLEGCARSIGKHAAGVVIAPNDIHEFTPLHYDMETNSMATQLDMYDVEDVGLVKFDFLGLRTLTVINNAVKSVQKINPSFNLDDISYGDSKVFNLLSSGKTKGIFQLESGGMMDLIKRMKPENFSDITALVALYRPGPLNSGMADDYINRKNGRESIAYQHPDLKKVLNETYGVFVYQEQVMEAAQVLAAYSLGDADNLRRAMGKKKADVMEAEKSVFVNGCENNSIGKKKANEIFDNIEKFAGYGFNKSHSAAYALIAYQTAFLKTHYPSHFIASVLSSEQDKTDKLEPHVKDCAIMGVAIVAPNINSSHPTFIVNDKDQIEYGLAALKDVGRKFVEEVCEERKNGKFSSLMDFASRVDLRKGGIRALQSMAKAGTFDEICSRDEAVSSIKNYLEASEQKFRSKESAVMEMFAEEQDLKVTGYKSQMFSESEKLKMELQSFGFYYSKHPISLVRKTLSSKIQPINKLITTSNEKYIPALINHKRIVKKGTSIFIFLEVSDETGLIDVSVPVELYDEKKPLFKENSVVMIKGTVVADDFRKGNLEDVGIKIRATDIVPIEIARKTVTSRIRLDVSRKKLKELGNGQFDKLKSLNDPNGIDVVLNLKDDELNISSLLKVDTFKISLEDSTFEKINELFGEENYQLF
ncbi:MAG: DNA polymerase III subunit alpha [Gammaproteobacteria bacterium TMED112]|nr:MAG: DNA polymerase III subunit alpha [Gammaproteobacteria bacterium TMED112]|tara:strand:+ start:11903 stop:15298 length:3396 start_codon:yes stop_codon:yes gene_type:complete